MTIRDVLIPSLEQTFPDRGLRLGLPPDPVAVFPANHPEVGDIEVWDDGNEVTIGIQYTTHGHFNPYDSTLTSEELANHVTESVIEFLSELFADKVLIWVADNGKSGGWQRLEWDKPKFHRNAKHYLWSGPIAPPAEGGSTP